MTKKTKRVGGSFATSAIIPGTLISLAVLTAISLIAGIILYMQQDPTSLIDIASLVVLLASAAVSGYTVSARTPERKILTVTLSSLLLCFLLYAVGMIVTVGGATGRVYLNYLCYMGVAVLFARLGSRARSRARRRRH